MQKARLPRWASRPGGRRVQISGQEAAASGRIASGVGRASRPFGWIAAGAGRTVAGEVGTAPDSGQTLPSPGQTVAGRGRSFIDNLPGMAASGSKDAAIPEGPAERGTRCPPPRRRRVCAGGAGSGQHPLALLPLLRRPVPLYSDHRLAIAAAPFQPTNESKDP